MCTVQYRLPCPAYLYLMSSNNVVCNITRRSSVSDKSPAQSGMPPETSERWCADEEEAIKAAGAKARLTFDLKFGGGKEKSNDVSDAMVEPAPRPPPRKKSFAAPLPNGPLTPNGEWMMTPQGGQVRVSSIREAIASMGDGADEENQGNIYAPRVPAAKSESEPLAVPHTPVSSKQPLLEQHTPSSAVKPETLSPDESDWITTPQGGQVRSSVVPATAFRAPHAPAVQAQLITVPPVQSTSSGVGAFIEAQAPWVQALARGVLCVCLPLPNEAVGAPHIV